MTTFGQIVMKDLLDVFVLFQAVDQFEDVLGLVFGQLDGGGRDPFELGADGDDAFFFQGLLHMTKIVEGCAQDDYGFVVFAGPFAHFFEAVVDEL
jgi:hypothetical protein